MARGTGSSGGEKRATPRGSTASDDSDQRYYVSLHLKKGYVRLGYDADELEDGFASPQDAIVRANAAVAEGPWVRAIVIQENDDDDALVALYDTAPDAPDARDASYRAAAHRPPREPDEAYPDNDGHIVLPKYGMRLSPRAMYELDSADDTLDGLAPEEEEWEWEDEELLLELIRDDIRCIWRGGTTISASNTDTGAVVDEIEINEPTAKCALTAMHAYYSANQRS